MRMRAALFFCCASFAAQLGHTETVVVDDKVAVRDSSLPRPARGMRMEQVEKQFGAPLTRHEAVGQPPITRWDYPAFSVFFERDIVIHSVVLGSPPPAPANDTGAPPATAPSPAASPAPAPGPPQSPAPLLGPASDG
jgi:hypothetical protein